MLLSNQLFSKFREILPPSLILFLLLSSCSYTDEPDPFEWQAFGLEGKRVFELSISENFLYAAAGKDGLYRKDLSDNSSQWEYLGLAVPEVNFGIRTFYRNPESGTMYVGFYEPNWDGPGLFRSTDDGQSWEPFDTGIKEQYSGRSAVVTKINASKKNPSQVFVGTSSAIFKSNKNNSGWELLGESAKFGKGVLSISFDPQNDQKLWAGGRSGFDTARLFFTVDGGGTWKPRMNDFNDLVILTNEVQAITINPNQTEIIYACLLYEILRSKNSGENWEKLDSGLNEEGKFRDRNNDMFTFFSDLSINPVYPDEIVASGRFLYKSRDAGETWEVASDTSRSIITDIQINWDSRIVYGALLNPIKGVFKIEI